MGSTSASSEDPELAIDYDLSIDDTWAILERVIRHVASQPITLGSLAVGHLFKRVALLVIYPCDAAIGRWERFCQPMVRRDGGKQA